MTALERAELERIASELHGVRVVLANLRSRIVLARASVGARRGEIMESNITGAKACIKSVEDMAQQALAELDVEE